MKKYGQVIAKLRKKEGLTQEQLGKKLNVTYQAVSKWENNLSEPDLETIEKIAQLFGITLTDFFDMAQSPEKIYKVESSQKKERIKFGEFVTKKPWYLVAGLGILIFILSLCAFFVPVKQSSTKIFNNISTSTFCVNTLTKLYPLSRTFLFICSRERLFVYFTTYNPL